jgi:hypothetical protein
MKNENTPAEGKDSEQTGDESTSDDAARSPRDIANGLLHAADDHPCCKATLRAAANLLENIPPANGPLRQAYSRQELAAKMAGWMVETWGHPMELTEPSRDRWMERNGMLYAFICDHFPAENRELSEPKSVDKHPNQ